MAIDFCIRRRIILISNEGRTQGLRTYGDRSEWSTVGYPLSSARLPGGTLASRWPVRLTLARSGLPVLPAHWPASPTLAGFHLPATRVDEEN